MTLLALTFVSVMAFVQLAAVPQTDVFRGAIIVYWALLVVSLALHGRAYLAIDQDHLRIRGRLRRRSLDVSSIQRFEPAPYAFDTWSALMLPRWLGTMHSVKIVFTDGSDMDIGSVLGSDLDCANLSHSLNECLRQWRHVH